MEDDLLDYGLPLSLIRSVKLLHNWIEVGAVETANRIVAAKDWSAARVLWYDMDYWKEHQLYGGMESMKREDARRKFPEIFEGDNAEVCFLIPSTI